MWKKTVITIGLLMVLSHAGCAAYVAGIDCDAALDVAAKANTQNLKAMAAARLREHDKSLEQVEAIFESQLAKVTTGAQAIQELTRYRAAKAKAQVAKDDASEKIQKTLNTGFWLESLVDRRIGLRAQWRGLIGQIPGVSQIETLAEAEVRMYMETLNKGVQK